jgi:tetratricopeptide (TPR) repeat protein
MSLNIDIEALLEAAISSHEARDLDHAEQLCREILGVDPDHAEALNLMGVILQDRGLAAESIPLITRATEIDPAWPDAFANLARGLRLLGEDEKAIAAARHATDLDPGLGEAWLQLGFALVTLEQFQEALDALREAAKHFPDSADVHSAIGFCAQTLKDYDTTIDAWSVVLETQPDRVDALTNLGAALTEMERYDEALAVLRRALELAPAELKVMAALAVTLYRRMDAEELTSICRAYLELSPGNVDMLTMLAGGLTWLGKLNEARAVCEAGLAAQPDSLWFKHQLNEMNLDGADRDSIAQFRADLDNTALRMIERLVAGFSLGTALERLSDYDGAFGAFATSNAMMQTTNEAAGTAFEIDQAKDAVDDICAFYTPELFERAQGWGNESELPVYIVGLPRSGTTLVEQIAASHPRVCGLGERKDMWELLKLPNLKAATRSLGSWDADRFRSETERHIAHLRALAGDVDRAIDKLPDNIQLLGQIRVLFPNARFIICRRDLRDVCLSCFTTHFKEDIKWSHDLETCARRAAEIDRLADHWRAVLPGPVLEVNYETLVGNLEEESRRLIAFLGLEWDPACLEFHKTERNVTTASLFQVRRPIYNSSIGRWRRYEAHLAPMLKILAGRVPEELGGMTDQGQRISAPIAEATTHEST